MERIFIEYPKCSTCQRAKAWLEENHISFVDRNIITDTPRPEELRKWIHESGLPIKRFFNTSGLVYKKLKLKDKLATMSEEEMISLLSQDGMLLKRPLLIQKGYICPGFRQVEWERHVK